MWCLTKEKKCKPGTFWGETDMRRKPVVFVNDFNCISRMMINLTFSLESFS